MQRKTETVSTPIRFWSDGNIARTAFDRIESLRSLNRSNEVRAMLDEWIVDKEPQTHKTNCNR